MIQVDLRAISVDPSTRAWRLFPGGDYKFLNYFLGNGTAFLDLPALTFPEGTLSASSELLARVLASQKTRDAINAHKDTSLPAITEWQQFLGARQSSQRMRTVSAVVNFYHHAKQGDYVIVPSTLSERRVHVGRFSSNAITSRKYRYGDHEIPTRSVNWLTSIDEGKISAPLSRSLRNQHPFSLVEKSRFVEVFALGSGTYRFGERTVSTVRNKNDDFLDADAALLSIIAKLSAAASAAVANDAQFKDTLSAVLSEVPIEYTCNQESDIHSDGFTRFISGKITPLVIIAVLACLLAADISKTESQIFAEVKDVVIVNGLELNDPCVPQVQEATRLVLNTVGVSTTYKLCAAAHAARERAGLESSAKTGN